MRKPSRTRHLSRNWHRRWTVDDDATLRRLWADSCAKVIRDALGRTEGAIRRRAILLDLPPQHQGRLPVHHLCAHLGLHAATFWAFARDAGITTQPLAPVQFRSRGTHYIQRSAPPDVCEILLHQRDTRCQRPGAWSRLRGHYTNYMRDVMSAAGLHPAVPGSRRHHDVPVGVLEELAAHQPGPWCAAWAKALSIPAAERPCAPWLLALAVHDQACGDDEWTWVLSQPVERAVRALGERPARRAAA